LPRKWGIDMGITYLEDIAVGKLVFRGVEITNQDSEFLKTGYGSKIQTGKEVRFSGRWYKVYSICYSNASSQYAIVNGRRLFIR